MFHYKSGRFTFQVGWVGMKSTTNQFSSCRKFQHLHFDLPFQVKAKIRIAFCASTAVINLFHLASEGKDYGVSFRTFIDAWVFMSL